MKSAPVAAAIARTSSCTGLPSVTPQRAFGSPIRAASCSVEHRLEAGETGRDHLRAAAEAGEEVRLDEAGRDPHVGLDPRAVEPHGHAAPSRPSQTSDAASRASWLTTRDRVDDVVAEHRPSSSSRVAAVRAGRDEDRRRPRRDDAVELVEDRRDHDRRAAAGGCRRTRDRDRLPGSHELAQRRPGDRRAGARLEHRRTLVGAPAAIGRARRPSPAPPAARPRGRPLAVCESTFTPGSSPRAGTPPPRRCTLRSRPRPDPPRSARRARRPGAMRGGATRVSPTIAATGTPWDAARPATPPTTFPAKELGVEQTLAGDHELCALELPGRARRCPRRGRSPGSSSAPRAANPPARPPAPPEPGSARDVDAVPAPVVGRERPAAGPPAARPARGRSLLQAPNTGAASTNVVCTSQATRTTTPASTNGFGPERLHRAEPAVGRRPSRRRRRPAGALPRRSPSRSALRSRASRLASGCVGAADEGEPRRTRHLRSPPSRRPDATRLPPVSREAPSRSSCGLGRRTRRASLAPVGERQLGGSVPSAAAATPAAIALAASTAVAEPRNCVGGREGVQAVASRIRAAG